MKREINIKVETKHKPIKQKNIMNKLQILSIQIQSDIQSLTDDVDKGLVDARTWAEEVKRIGEKIRQWSVEALKMIEKIGKEREIEEVKDEHIRAEILNDQKEE